MKLGFCVSCNSLVPGVLAPRVLWVGRLMAEVGLSQLPRGTAFPAGRLHQLAQHLPMDASSRAFAERS